MGSEVQKALCNALHGEHKKQQLGKVAGKPAAGAEGS